MPQLILMNLKSDTCFQFQAEPDGLPSREIVQDLLFQLQDSEPRHPNFQLARTRLRRGHGMRAIRECCDPFNFDARVSRSRRYLKFDVRVY